jgi:predicted nucleotidyltransferase
MQMRLLGLLLLQPERDWTLKELAGTLGTPQSSVHRELERAEGAGLIERDGVFRPHRFRAAANDSLYEPLATLLRRSIGVEGELRSVLTRPDIVAAVIHGSWASGPRRPGSDIDVLVVGDVDVRELRRLVRPIGKGAGRTIDITVLAPTELRKLRKSGSSFTRRIEERHTVPLVGDLPSLE